MVEEAIEEGNNEKNFLKENYFLILIFISIIVVVILSFYNFYIKKNFDFIVETSCNPDIEECTYRDCTNRDDCPPNQLSTFKRYVLKANDFLKCPNEDCKELCEKGEIKCELLSCEEDLEYREYCEPIEIENEEGALEEVETGKEAEVQNTETENTNNLETIE